jgi:predicted RNA-binding protein with PUA-like domain
MKHWLMKSEPEVYSIDHLKKDKTTLWTGVRNYQARNFMWKEMKLGDRVLFYHSNANPSGVAGLAQVSSEAVPDPTQFNKKSEYYDPKASVEKPIWYCVEVKFLKKFDQVMSLDELRNHKALSTMLVLKKGQRLSVQPVSEREYLEFVSLEDTL